MSKENARSVYADIIDLPYHQSITRKHMSLYDRAAQFASYKALSGYEDMVAEGGWNKAQAAGKLRIEGKDYEVADGDVIHVRFSV